MMIPRFFRAHHFLAVKLALVACCLGLTAACCVVYWMRVAIPRGRAEAEARWAADGRPMPEFVKKHTGETQENESLRAMLPDLEPFGVVSFYRPDVSAQDVNHISIADEITNFIVNQKPMDGDEVDPAAEKLPYLDQHAADLDSLYRGILQREPAVWSCIPEGGSHLRVMNWLAARRLAQLICVDALHKLERGDTKGASTAVEAGLKMTEGMKSQPLLVSVMIRSAIEALFAQAVARLPEDPGAMKRLAADVAARREWFRIALQAEAWNVERMADYMGSRPEDFQRNYGAMDLPGRLRFSLLRAMARSDANRHSSSMAEHVRITSRVEGFAASDLGTWKMRDAGARWKPDFTWKPLRALLPWESLNPDMSRAWLRLNVTLLLREQAELIRSARAEVLGGKSGVIGEPESVVIPGAKWIITGDSAAGTVTLKLTPRPQWTLPGEVFDESFFLLPLDGSKPWKYKRTGANP